MNSEQITNLLRNVIDEVVAKEKRPVTLSTNELIYRFELHIIEAIGNNANITVNELAKKMNVTKGAISQVVTKLVQKGIVVRNKNLYNKKIVELVLTSKGEKIYQGHEQFHANINEQISEHLSKYSEAELQLIYDVLLKIKNLMTK